MWTLNFLSKLKGLAPLVLRGVLGVSFFVFHGMDKMQGGKDSAWDWGAAFASGMAEKAPTALLYVAAWTEFLGGLALILGLLTRWASLGLLCVMLYAIFVVHAADPYGAKEKAIAYAGMLIVLLGTGPGKLSLDAMFFGRKGVEQ